MAAKGVLEDDRVRVIEEREANVLYNKGAFGVPQSGGALLLDLLESTYLVEANRLEVGHAGRVFGVGDLLEYAGARESGFDVSYIVYRDLRGRGFLVKRGGAATDFHVYPRGSTMGKSPSSHHVLALSERAPFDAEDLLARARAADDANKRLFVGLVDEEGDLTYYDADAFALEGRMGATSADARGLEGVLIEDRVFLFDDAARARLHDERHLGMVIGPALQLSLPEAVYLAREGGLALRTHEGPVGVEAVEARARAVEPRFDDRYGIYVHLSSLGLVPRTGFKFGCDFRAYRGDPDEAHAPYLVHGITASTVLTWPEVSGFVRLAHGVRKEFLFMVAGAFLRLRRAKP